MTPQDHNKVIGIMHLIWGGFNALIAAFIVPFIIAIVTALSRDPHAPPEAKAFFGFFGLLMAAFMILFSLPPLLAGYALLKRKSWAKVAGIIAAGLTAMSVPFGTALTVYTIWFLCGEQGDRIYGKRTSAYEPWRGSLRDANAFDWEAQRRADARRREQNYAPPPQPPDWRS
jgi:hypothetical protein